MRRAAVRVTLTGTHQRPLLGIPPTERRISLVLHEFHQLVDGRIAVTRHTEDWLGYFFRLELFPKTVTKTEQTDSPLRRTAHADITP